jgi:hypothetical protein
MDVSEETLSDASLEFIRIVLRPTETEWVTKYKQRIPVTEMEDAHNQHHSYVGTKWGYGHRHLSNPYCGSAQTKLVS